MTEPTQLPACRKGHVKTPDNTVVLYSHGKPYRQCKKCRADYMRAWYRKKLLRKNAAKLAEGLMRTAERFSPSEDPERFMDKGDDPTAGRSCIGQMLEKERA